MPSEAVLSTAQVAQRCARAMAHYRLRKEPDARPCYELFHRALVDRDQEAWTAIYVQYQRLVRHWLGSACEDPEGLVNQAFERLWRALPPERFADFATLDAILKFLKRCAQNLAIDAARRRERRRAYQSALICQHRVTGAEGHASSTEQVLDAIVADQVYERVMDAMNDAQERLVVRASFEWNLKPRMIAERWPHLFADARQVSRVKERVLRRLQRDGELCALLGTDCPRGGEI